MTSIRRFEYSNDKQITTQKTDEFADFLWVGFAKNSDGNCILEKQAKFFPTQTYFTIERAVDQIVEMDLDDTNLYVAYNDTTLLGEIYSKTNPLTTATEIPRDSIVESPVDVKIDILTDDLWFLLPGNASGTNAQLLRYDTVGVLQQTVDLVKSGNIVINASTMTIDENSDIWIGTFTNPATVVRVFQISGGLYDFSVTEIV